MDVLQLLPRHDRPKTFSDDDWDSVIAKTSIIREAEHGQIEMNAFGRGYTYRSDNGFEGEDRFTLQTTYKGQQFIIHYRIDILPEEDASFAWEKDCNKPPFTYPKPSSSLFNNLLDYQRTSDILSTGLG
jgi:hypothetical protein